MTQVLILKSQQRFEVGFTNGISYSSLVDNKSDRYFDYLPTYTIGGTLEYLQIIYQ
jgi:hypothetical protein